MKSNGSPSFYLEAFVLFLSCSSLIWRDAASIGQPPGPRTTFTVVENQTEGETVGQVVQSGGAHFSFVEDSPLCNEFFTINANTSIIRTVGLLDREAIVKRIDTDKVHCFVHYFNSSTRAEQNTRITINVLDINDEVPQFHNLVQPHMLQVTENVAVPTPLLSLEPIDNDSGANKTVRFNITSGNTDYFKIMRPEGDNSDTDTRILFLQRELDFEIEQDRMFNLTIRISDMGSPMNTFDQQIVVVLNNTLDEPPTFPMSSFYFNIPEDQPVGRSHPFDYVTAANTQQVLGSIFYNICEESGCPRVGPAGVILVNQVTGGLYLNSSVDFDADDAVRVYTFYVTALNPGTRSSQNAYVSVTVLSVNDNAPYVTCAHIPANGLECPDADVKLTEVDFDIVENSGMARLWLDPHDDDYMAGDDSTIEYNITSDPQIDVTNSTAFDRYIVVEIGENLDREATPNVTILFTIYNMVLPYMSSTLVIRVHVGDINDNPPIFTNTLYRAYVSEGSPINKEVLRVEASDSDAGSNADITYAIEAVDKQIAESWFKISPTTGAITVNGTRVIDYHKVEGVVVLNVTATDNGRVPLSSSTTVEVKVVPAITFSARSHQAFASYNLAAADLNSVLYVEFQTSSNEGLLLYQQEGGSHFILSLEERRAVFKHRGDDPKRSDATFVDNTWHSVLVERSGEGISVTLQRVESGGGAPAVLSGAQIQNCTNVSEELLNREEFLFIGGYNPLSVRSVNSPPPGIASDFVGAIRNVIIGGSQVNLRCPQEEKNTLIGERRSNQCRDEKLQCHPLHSTRCVDYAEEQSFCSCLGGFPSQVCRASTQQDSYAPIRLHGTGHVSTNLSYSFLYDLEMLKRSRGDASEDSVGPGVGAKRKRRREVSDPESSVVTLQKVEIRFRPVEVGDSVLLQAENKDFVHRLTTQETGTQYAVKYEVFDKLNSMTTPSIQILITNLNLQNRTEYQVSITYTNIEVIMDLTDSKISKQNNYPWASKRRTLFVEQPDTTLSIGGAPGETDFFVGCISSLKIDKLELPLSGLAALPAAEGGFSNSSVDAAEPYCDLCDLTTCPTDSNCLSNGYGATECACLPGLVFDGSRDICVSIVVTPPGAGLSTSAFTAQTTYYIAGGTAGGVLLIALLILLLVFAIRVKQVKRGKRKRTYSVTAIDGILPPQRTSKTVNEYVRVEPRKSSPNGDSLTCITTVLGRPENHERGSSVSTFQEHADDADPDLDDPPRLQRRKSTVSAESGIRTDTERDSSLRGTSRMDDSGTDYTPQESESDDVISSCFMEPVASPAGIHLVESPSSLMGVPIKVASPTIPLTPQERKLITPLRPDSIRLSISEDDRRDTDIDTDYSLHNLPAIHQNIPMQRETDSDASTKVSDMSTPKWYKSSTASDNERERERALKNRAYYPTRSQSMPYQPHPPRPKTAFGAAAPEYVPPPSISMRKSASPVFPRSPTRRLPPTMMQADSHLTRNTRKYENYPLHLYSMHPPPPPPPPSSDAMRERNRHGVLPSYENHCLQHQFSAPQSRNRDKNHLNAQQGRHVYFAKSSQTLHYPAPPHEEQNSHSNSRQFYTLASTLPSSLQYRQNRSFSSGDAPPPEREQTQFQDLKNVSTINPISYWEMQDRLKPAVDQVDPYQVLSEPYIQFEDVSTDLSVSESQVTINAEGPDHEVFESQGGGEGAADIGPGCLSRLEDHEISSVISESQSIRGGITHFPSADCSNEYTATINGTSSTSGDSTPKFQPINGFFISSQQSFDV